MVNLTSSQKLFGYETPTGIVKWSVLELIELTEAVSAVPIKAKVFKKAFDRFEKNFNKEDIERLKHADTRYPIIVSINSLKNEYPIIVDGNHRIGKILKHKGGHAIVQVKLIDKMPKPVICEGVPFKVDGLNFDWVSTPPMNSKKWIK